MGVEYPKKALHDPIVGVGARCRCRRGAAADASARRGCYAACIGRRGVRPAGQADTRRVRGARLPEERVLAEPLVQRPEIRPGRLTAPAQQVAPPAAALARRDLSSVLCAATVFVLQDAQLDGVTRGNVHRKRTARLVSRRQACQLSSCTSGSQLKSWPEGEMYLRLCARHHVWLPSEGSTLSASAAA